MSTLQSDEWILNLPSPPPMVWQYSLPDDLQNEIDVDEMRRYLDENMDTPYIDNTELLAFDLPDLHTVCPLLQQQQHKECKPPIVHNSKHQKLFLAQFTTITYNRYNIGLLVAGFMSSHSAPRDLHSIVFRYYFDEEDQVLHFGCKISHVLDTKFSGQQLMEAVDIGLRENAIANLDASSMSHKLLQCNHIELVAYETKFSSLFKPKPLSADKLDQRFDDKHMYRFTTGLCQD